MRPGPSIIYAVAFAPGVIKVGRSGEPFRRIATLSYRADRLVPKHVDFKTRKMIGLAEETDELREGVVHKALFTYRVNGCREWFVDCPTVRRKLRHMGVHMKP